ncbi:MAG: ABC transporter permease, partial [Halieaceae bacterium]|nr:ABC transporter permease [Halieaceae bacterium]
MGASGVTGRGKGPVARVRTRLWALIKKETLQVLRDPASLLIAFVLPPVLLMLFTSAVSLDVKAVPFGVVLESDGAEAHSLASAYAATPYLNVMPVRNRKQVEPLLVSGQLRGFVVIPQDFDRLILEGNARAPIQIITDGSLPNSANYTAAYAQGVFQNWLADYTGAPDTGGASFQNESRFWFNAELESRAVLLPGAIAVVMTIIGTLLTALVVAREWERGTMEALMSTPVGILEIIVSKLVPYYVLGLIATVGCGFLAVGVLGMPLKGSPMALLLVSGVFLVPALGQGLLISTLAKNQFVAAQVALLSAFLPALLLSGFLYEVQGMP